MIKRQVIYDGTQEQFFQDVRLNKLADRMKDSFEENSGRTVGESEYSSWVVTGDKIKNLIESAGLSDIYLSFEYQVLILRKELTVCCLEKIRMIKES